MKGDGNNRSDLEGDMQRLRVALKNSRIIVYNCDAALRYTWIANPSHGFGTLDVIGRRDDELLPPEAVADLSAFKQQVLETGCAASREIAIPLAGETRFYDVTAEPMRGADGEIAGLTVAVLDTTAQRQAEASLRRSEERFRLLFEHAPTGIALIGPDERIVDANRALCTTMGYEREEILGSCADRMTHPDDRAAEHESLGRLRRGVASSYNLEKRCVRKDGKTIWVRETTSLAEASESGSCRITVLVDITEQRVAQTALQATERRLRRKAAEIEALYQAAPIGLAVVDREHRLIRLNHALAAINGRAVEESLGRYGWDVGPGAAEQVRPLIQHVLDTGEAVRDAELRSIDGTGTERHWLASYVPLYGPCGAVDAVACMVQDITDRKRTERDQEALIAQKELLLRELNHRIKNNLQTVSSLLRLQAHAMRDGEGRRGLEQACQRVAAIHGLYARLDQSASGSVDFGDYLESLCGRLRDTLIGPGRRIGLTVSADRVPMSIDRAVPLGLIVNELVTNALKHAFPDGGEGRVTVAFEVDRNRYVLSVSDDGRGLPPDSENGLGLGLIRGLVAQLDGALEFVPSPGVCVKVTIGA